MLPKRAGALSAKFHHALHERVDVHTDRGTIFSQPKFLGYRDNQICLPTVLRCARVRELRYEKAAPSLVYDISLLFETGMKGDVET